MTLNGVMAITLRYFTEFGKPVLQKTICGGIYARIYCILVRVQCRRKEFTFAISSPDEFLVCLAYTSSSFRVGLQLCRKSEGLAYENAENRCPGVPYAPK